MAHFREASSAHSHDFLGGVVEPSPITHQISHDEKISFGVRSGSALLAAYHLELEEVFELHDASVLVAHDEQFLQPIFMIIFNIAGFEMCQVEHVSRRNRVVIWKVERVR